ncbi:MAG: DUF1579 domain-containing protein [Candidatus Eremiobacteraeota bacterium]|nr:DUF1579 domain-containing protein [Candidatus Eremiobacteraeota bacterium]
MRILMAGTLVLAALLSSSGSSSAQNTSKGMQMPAMTAQHRQLAALAGDWVITGQTHKGCPYGEGKFTAREHSELMKGGMFLVSRTQYSSLFKNSNQIAVVGVDSATKQYTYAMYSNTGVTVQATGAVRNTDKASLVGNAIQWTSKTNADMAAGQEMVYTTEMLSPNRYKFRLVVGGGAWYDGIANRVNPVVNPAR